MTGLFKGRVLALVAGSFLFSAPQVHAADRNGSLINSFLVFCATQPPDFASINAKATAMRLPVRSDVGNGAGHSKSWGVSLTDGPHQLLAAEGDGPNGHVDSCGISAADPDGKTFRDKLVSTLKLRSPSSEGTSKDGTQRISNWTGVFGANTALELVDGSPASAPGIILLYIKLQPKTR